MRRAAFVFLLASMGACRGGDKRGASTPLLASSAPIAAASASGVPLEDEADPALFQAAPPPPVNAGPFRDSVRAGRWAEAEERLAKLSDDEKKTPPIRYVRAVVASERKKWADVQPLLEGVDTELPMLAKSVAELRAEAQAEVGPFAAAGTFFAAQHGARSLFRSAQAFQKAGQPDDAHRSLDRAIAAAKGGAIEARARALRAKVADGQGQKDVAIGDATWVVKTAPGTDEDVDCQAILARLSPTFQLGAHERLNRAEKLEASGKLEAALAEIDLAGKTNPPATKAELLHARGRALYKGRRFAEAAETLKAAADAAGGHGGEDEFLAIRSLSRADKDDEAIGLYRTFADQNPKSDWADDALFLSARLQMLLGKNDGAEQTYKLYGKRFPRGKNKDDARYELGLVELARKDDQAAQRTFEALAKDAEKGEIARLEELAGVAALHAGDTDAAKALFTRAAKGQPLSFGALTARARLQAMNAPLPPLIEPAESKEVAPLDAKLPPPAALLVSLGLTGEAEDMLKTGEKALSAAYTPRGTEALCTLYDAVDRAARRFRLANDQVRAETVMKAPSSATRWAWECLYPRPFLDLVTADEQREKLPPGLVYGIMRQESAFSPDVVSGAHAVGLLQLLPGTAAQIAKKNEVAFVDGTLDEPPVNIDLGSRYLAFLLGQWKGNLPLAIASYNAGPKAVSRWLERGGVTEIDVFVARIPYAETRNYVTRVTSNVARYAYLYGGESTVPSVPIAIEPGLKAGEDAF